MLYCEKKAIRADGVQCEQVVLEAVWRSIQIYLAVWSNLTCMRGGKRPVHIEKWLSTTGQIFWRFICHNRIVGKRCLAVWIYVADLSVHSFYLIHTLKGLRWTNVIRAERKHMVQDGEFKTLILAGYIGWCCLCLCFISKGDTKGSIPSSLACYFISLERFFFPLWNRKGDV